MRVRGATAGAVDMGPEKVDGDFDFQGALGKFDKAAEMAKLSISGQDPAAAAAPTAVVDGGLGDAMADTAATAAAAPPVKKVRGVMAGVAVAGCVGLQRRG